MKGLERIKSCIKEELKCEANSIAIVQNITESISKLVAGILSTGHILILIESTVRREIAEKLTYAFDSAKYKVTVRYITVTNALDMSAELAYEEMIDDQTFMDKLDDDIRLCCAVGAEDTLNFARYYSTKYNIMCCVLPTAPISNLMQNHLKIIEKGDYKYTNLLPINVFIDYNLYEFESNLFKEHCLINIELFYLVELFFYLKANSNYIFNNAISELEELMIEYFQTDFTDNVERASSITEILVAISYLKRITCTTKLDVGQELVRLLLSAGNRINTDIVEPSLIVLLENFYKRIDKKMFLVIPKDRDNCIKLLSKLYKLDYNKYMIRESIRIRNYQFDTFLLDKYHSEISKRINSIISLYDFKKALELAPCSGYFMQSANVTPIVHLAPNLIELTEKGTILSQLYEIGMIG